MGKDREKVTRERLDRVWRQFVDYAERKDDLPLVAEKLYELLDGLMDEDYFGTEGQCDPRGDQRE